MEDEEEDMRRKRTAGAGRVPLFSRSEKRTTRRETTKGHHPHILPLLAPVFTSSFSIHPRTARDRLRPFTTARTALRVYRSNLVHAITKDVREGKREKSVIVNRCVRRRRRFFDHQQKQKQKQRWLTVAEAARRTRRRAPVPS